MTNYLENIWQKIIKETENFQLLDGNNKGLVKNFVVDDFYYRETAFAAKIFATEYDRTNNSNYKEKAILAIEAVLNKLSSIDIKNGIDEPQWTPRGILYRKGSIPSTIILLYALFDSADMLNYKIDIDLKKIIDFLKECYLGDGRFYHDKVETNKKYQKVINTTAMAYFFLEFSKSKGIEDNFYYKNLELIKKAIISSQRKDGFFPYLEYNLFIQSFIFSLTRFLPNKAIKIYNRLLGDRSIFFGDAIHHIITLYYYILGVKFRNIDLTESEKNMLVKGYQFIKSKLVYDKDYIYFDYSWEPKPRYLRYCNFIDTSFYFYFLDFLSYMHKYNLIKKNEYNELKNGLLKFINNSLLQNDIPSIKPYQGGEDFLHFIMPRPSESVFDKGFFLSNLVLDEL